MEPTQIVGQDDFAFFSRERAEEYRAEDRQVMTDGKIRALDERYTVAGLRQWIAYRQDPLPRRAWRDHRRARVDSRTFPSAS